MSESHRLKEMREPDEDDDLRNNGGQPGLAFDADGARYPPLYENEGHVIPALGSLSRNKVTQTTGGAETPSRRHLWPLACCRRGFRLAVCHLSGTWHSKFSAAFVSPWPLYRATAGYAHKGRVT